MASFQVRVLDYIGTLDDTTAITDWCTAGARFIVDLLPEHILNEYATSVTVTASGLSMASYRIHQALKNGYEAKLVPTGMLTAVQDSNSIHYALSASPVSVVYSGKIYIYPNGGEVLAMAYPTVLYSASSISNFPTRMEHGVVLYAAIQGMLRKSSDALTSVSSVSLPTAPTAPSFSFTDVTGQTVTLPTAPSYTTPGSNVSFTNLQTYIATEEDLEKAGLEVQQQNLKLDELQKNLFDKLNAFNADLEEYKVQITKYIEDARMAQEAGLLNSVKDLEASISEYASKLNKYQSEIQAYTNQISANVNLVQGYLLLADKIKAEFNDFINGSIRSDG